MGKYGPCLGAFKAAADPSSCIKFRCGCAFWTGRVADGLVHGVSRLLKGWKSPVNDEATGKEKQDNMEPPVSSVTVYIRCIDAWEQGWAGHTQLQVAAQGE
jgi:hypothetical protein